MTVRLDHRAWQKGKPFGFARGPCRDGSPNLGPPYVPHRFCLSGSTSSGVY